MKREFSPRLFVPGSPDAGRPLHLHSPRVQKFAARSSPPLGAQPMGPQRQGAGWPGMERLGWPASDRFTE